jgi:chromosome segregation ATPase
MKKERQKYQELLRIKEQGELRYSQTLHRLQEDYDILQSQTDEKLNNQVRKYQDNEMRHMESLKKTEQKYDSLKKKVKHRKTHDEGVQAEGNYTSTGEEVKMLRERLDILNKDYESLKLENHNRLTRETQNYQQLLQNKLDQEKHYEKVLQEYDNLYSKFEDRVLEETQHKDKQINTLRSQFEESFKSQKKEQDKLNSLIHSQQLEIHYLKSLIQDSEHYYRLPKAQTQDSHLSTQETSQIQKTSSALELPYSSRLSQRYSVEQAPDGRHTISGSGESKVIYWNFNPKSSGILLKQGPKDWSLELSKGNKYMISTGDDGMVRVWSFSGSN